MSAHVTADRILLIDDDDVFVRVLARALGARGFAVSTAIDRAQALAAARSMQPAMRCSISSSARKTASR